VVVEITKRAWRSSSLREDEREDDLLREKDLQFRDSRN